MTFNFVSAVRSIFNGRKAVESEVSFFQPVPSITVSSDATIETAWTRSGIGYATDVDQDFQAYLIAREMVSVFETEESFVVYDVDIFDVNGRFIQAWTFNRYDQSEDWFYAAEANGLCPEWDQRRVDRSEYELVSETNSWFQEWN